MLPLPVQASPSARKSPSLLHLICFSAFCAILRGLLHILLFLYFSTSAPSRKTVNLGKYQRIHVANVSQWQQGAGRENRSHHCPSRDQLKTGHPGKISSPASLEGLRRKPDGFHAQPAPHQRLMINEQEMLQCQGAHECMALINPCHYAPCSFVFQLPLRRAYVQEF